MTETFLSCACITYNFKNIIEIKNTDKNKNADVSKFICVWFKLFNLKLISILILNVKSL